MMDLRVLRGGQRSVNDRIPAYALFTDPPLGRVGRARERGETQGFMKVPVDAQTERILGAALLCIEGDEIVHSLLDAMAAGASCRVLQRAVRIHSTVSELIATLLGRLEPLKP